MKVIAVEGEWSFVELSLWDTPNPYSWRRMKVINAAVGHSKALDKDFDARRKISFMYVMSKKKKKKKNQNDK